MEELFVYIILLQEGFITETEYNKQLHGLFLTTPENEDLLYLEWETDIRKAVLYAKAHMDCENLDFGQFGRIFMARLKIVYENCTDIKDFAGRMYHLWQNLPANIQNIEPFRTLSYADDPLSWGDEKQTRDLYEQMMNYYEAL